MARVDANARATRMVVGVSLSPAAGIDTVATGELAGESTAPTLTDERDATRAETAPRDTT